MTLPSAARAPHCAVKQVGLVGSRKRDILLYFEQTKMPVLKKIFRLLKSNLEARRLRERTNPRT